MAKLMNIEQIMLNKNNLERLYESMLKKYDKDDKMMKSLKSQINESKLPIQSFENAYITGKIKR